MTTNNFLTFAQNSGANVLSQTDWAALTDLLGNGFHNGVADPKQFNKAIRQSAAISNLIGAFIAANGYDALDDATPSTLLSNFNSALGEVIAASTTTTPLHGQCRFDYVSSTSVNLSRFSGNKIIINGTAQTIPSAGVSAANTGLTASTLYYVYAYMVSSTMTLEFSTTTHATDSTTGVEIKSGDATRTLVGMLYTGSGTPGVFQGGALTLSYFNRRSVLAKATLGSSYSKAGLTTWNYVSGTQAYFLAWANDLCHLEYSGTHYVTAGSSITLQSQLGLDALTSAYGGAAPQGAGQPSYNYFSSFYSTADTTLAEGVHYVVGLMQAYSGSGVTAVAMSGNFAAATTQG